MVLADTNIFLEILLEQANAAQCSTFLNERVGQLILSDFSLHSVGVVLSRLKRVGLFETFLTDVLPNVEVAHLPLTAYSSVVKAQRDFSLDFDDAYQVAIAQHYRSSLATLDRDFKRVSGLEILFLPTV